MRLATTAEIVGWDDLAVANPGGPQILQTRGWGEFKARWGWEPRYVIHEGPDADIAVLFLRRRIRGLGELWYAPKGPAVGAQRQLVDVLQGRGIFGNAFAIKVEPELAAADGDADLRAAGLRKAARDVQITRATILVDLRPSEDDLLASFKSKCRYNIRLAARKGVVVRHVEVDSDTVDVMFRLMSATQSRAGFTLRQRGYYDDYWRLQNACGQGDFFFAFKGDEVLAGVFVTRFGNRAWYKDGGSTKRHSELMAPHLLQWEVMRWLRGEGIETYDLVAVPRPSELDEAHPMWGLYRFKSGFNEEITEYTGTWDLALSERRYGLWLRAGERVAHQWSYHVHHDMFY